MRLLAHGLTRSAGGRSLFRDLRLHVDRGERLAVLGPSGAGKTLLLRALAWLDPFDAGEVTLDDRSPVAWGIPNWRAEVCFVPQTPPTLSGTPAAYLAEVQRLRVQRMRASGDAVELAERWGLARGRWQQPWMQLSGGERQRALLAITVSRNPAVLLLDEPTAALDASAARAVEETLAERSALWVTHDRAQAARVAHRILELGT